MPTSFLTNATRRFDQWFAQHPLTAPVLDAPRKPACFKRRPRLKGLLGRYPTRNSILRVESMGSRKE